MNEAMKQAWLEISQMLGEPTREELDVFLRAWQRAIKAEREQIAQMIEAAPPLVQLAQNEHGGCLMCGFTPKLAAAAIRARSEQ